jgi:glycosyltransferase involved in cell wall biosynthesis
MVKINILLVTYNHEKFIREALDGVFIQNYPGEMEIIVADDGSNDGTIDAIREYEGQDSRFTFIFLDSSFNRGITRNYERGFAACRADYVAVLEGDDYWTSPEKLEKQVAFLANHRECVLCSTNYIVFDESNANYLPRKSGFDGFMYLDSRSLISDNLIGNFSNCVYRTSELRKLPKELFDIKAYDWAINIFLGKFGLIAFLNEPTSVYRVHAKGAWSLLTHQQKLAEQLEIIPHYDEITGRVFHDEFAKLASELTSAGATNQLKLKSRNYLRRLARGGLHFARQCCPPLIVTIIRQIMPPFVVQRVQHLLGKRDG